jgi:hypothetical protein
VTVVRQPTRRAGRRPLERLVKAYGTPWRGALEDPVVHVLRTLGMGPGGEKGRFNPLASQQKFWPGWVTNGVTATDFLSWTVPKNARVVSITVLGAGAAGSSAFQAASGSTGGGGAGGGSGACAALTIPARFLPQTLYLSAAVGGLGTATSATAGGGGQITYVTDQPGVSDGPDVILASGNVPATSSATQATATAGATAGAAETIATRVNAVLAALGVWSAVVGVAGIVGGADTAAGGNITWGSIGLPTSGGAGGAGKNATTGHAGGNITGTDVYNTLTGGAASTTAAAGNGPNGWMFTNPYVGSGGAGGGSAGTTGTGGGGGNGGWGGGGGGNGSGVTSAASGNGGPGFVLISWW